MVSIFRSECTRSSPALEHNVPFVLAFIFYLVIAQRGKGDAVAITFGDRGVELLNARRDWGRL